MDNELYSLPDISFIDNLTLEQVRDMAIAKYEEEYEKITGESITLAPADPHRTELYACAYLIHQGLQYIDKMGKMQFTKYSYGEYLKNLAAWKKVNPLEPKAAYTTQRFYLQSMKTTTIAIPKGTRVTGDYKIFFETTEYAEIEVGETYVDVNVSCTEVGEIGNGIVAQYLNVLVDPIPYVYKTENLQETEGGTAEESDEALRERCYDAPGSYSTAGPELAYQFWVKSFSTDILDQRVISPDADCIDIYIIMQGGEMPSESTLEQLLDYLDDETKRPLNDKVRVLAPEQVEYSIDVKYFIATGDAKQAVVIQKKVSKALEEYKLWQQSRIGRDIDLGELVSRIRIAGAKRVEVNSASYIKLTENQVARLASESIVYGGLEDD